MFTLDIIYENSRTCIVVENGKEISNLFNLLLPKEAEVKIYSLGCQITNEILGTAYDQLVRNFSHEK